MNTSNYSNGTSNSSGIGQDLDSIIAFCQNTHAEARLQHYQIEQHQQAIQALRQKVESLELHKATQVGQDKIIGFMVGAIVLSLLSLATSIFFQPPESLQQASHPRETASRILAN